MKSVLLTGVNGGIGKAIAKTLLEQGYEVIGIDLKPCQETANLTAVVSDITDEASLQKVASALLKQKKSLFAIINAAGMFAMDAVSEGDKERFAKILSVNVIGPFLVNKTFLPMLEKGGRIINITSEVANYSPQPFNGYYSISKIAVDAYADCLRRELAYRDIASIKIQAGAIKTGLLLGVDGDYQKLVAKTSFYKKPLTKLKFMMDKEITKQTPPELLASYIAKILQKQHPKACYRFKNSPSLRFLSLFPERVQDLIYRKVIS